MRRASLRIYPPVNTANGELCFVRFSPGEAEGQPKIADLLGWMEDNAITALDDGPQPPRKPGATLNLERAAERDTLWFFIDPHAAVHMRLRWAEHIER